MSGFGAGNKDLVQPIVERATTSSAKIAPFPRVAAATDVRCVARLVDDRGFDCA
jgi:hypothetical protein